MEQSAFLAGPRGGPANAAEPAGAAGQWPGGRRVPKVATPPVVAILPWERLWAIVLRWRLPLALAGTALLALAIRLPAFTEVPGYTDETEEALLALRIFSGMAHPLTNVAPYIGPGWNYLLAGLFLVVGPSPDAPRALMVLLGTATVPLVGWLAARQAGLAGGLVAAGLMATSGLAVLLGSHVAWSVCTTPLLFGLSLVLFHVALERDAGRWFAGAALSYAFAVQAHPVVSASGPGLLAALLAAPAGRRLLRSRWAGLGALLGLLVLAPPLISAVTGASPLVELQGPLHRRTFLPTLVPGEVLLRVPALLGQLLRAASSVLQEDEGGAGCCLSPRLALFALWLGTGLVVALRRCAWLLVLPLLSYTLLWPLVNANYRLFWEARYTIHQLPVLYTLLALPAAELAARAARLSPLSRRLAARLTLGGLLVGACLWPLDGLWSYTQLQRAHGHDNGPLLEALRLADEHGGSRTLLLVDGGLKKPGLEGGGTYFQSVIYRRAMAGAPYRAVDASAGEEERNLRATGPERILLLSRPRQAHKLKAVYALQEVRRFEASGELLFVLYRGTKRH